MHFFIYEFNNKSGNVLNEHTFGNLNDALEYYQKLVNQIGLAHVPEGDFEGFAIALRSEQKPIAKTVFGSNQK
jgi:hypothetical protein